MEESYFIKLATQELQKIESLIEQHDLDIDINPAANGILELTTDDDATIIINLHHETQEIWLAARTGAYHFQYTDGRWFSKKNNKELYEILSTTLSSLLAQAIALHP